MNKNGMEHFSEVSLLITHYNRSASLERLLKTFEELGCSFGETVVSDDGSKPEHIEKLKELQDRFKFRLITSPVNKGLGNNINKGQDAVTLPYTLYVQEDFVPQPAFAVHFKDALQFMHEQADLDIIRFYAYFQYPYTTPAGKGFSKMNFSNWPWYANHLKYYVYSDHPHLRRSSFLKKFGRYAEGIKGDETEYRMALSFIRNKGKGLFFTNFNDVFDQKNTEAEPSTMNRSNWRSSKNIFILLVREVYLQFKLLKCTFDVLSGK